MCIRKEFERIAKEVYNSKNKSSVEFSQISSTPKNSNNSAILSEDQYIGIVRIEKSIPSFVEWLESPEYLKEKATEEKKQDLKKKRVEIDKKICNRIKKESLKTIVIVLESPHKDEFLNNDSVGVAVGKTGENLFHWLPQVLLNYVPCEVEETTAKAKYHGAKDIESGIYAIRIVNAIQYQCSLGEDTEKYRDDIFSKLWDSSMVQNDFIDRLEKSHPDIIINCCTKGNYKKSEEEKELRRKVQNVIDSQNYDTLILKAAHPSSYHFKAGLFYAGN